MWRGQGKDVYVVGPGEGRMLVCRSDCLLSQYRVALMREVHLLYTHALMVVCKCFCHVSMVVS